MNKELFFPVFKYEDNYVIFVSDSPAKDMKDIKSGCAYFSGKTFEEAKEVLIDEIKQRNFYDLNTWPESEIFKFIDHVRTNLTRPLSNSRR